jgi:predicted acylesterase/phospholipase RssA
MSGFLFGAIIGLLIHSFKTKRELEDRIDRLEIRINNKLSFSEEKLKSSYYHIKDKENNDIHIFRKSL